MIAVRSSAGAVLVLAAIAGCGSASSGRADTVQGQGQPTRTATPQTAAKPTFVLTASEIKRRLLRVSDMPSGFTVDKSKDDNSSTPSGCKKLDALDGYDKQTKVSQQAKFTGGTFGPFVQESVTVPHASAMTIYRQFVDAMRTCPSFRSKNDDGSFSSVTISGMSFPKLADDTFAAQMRIAPVPMVGSVYVDLVLVRIGNVFTLMTDAQLAAAPDATVVEGLARKAVGRLQHG